MKLYAKITSDRASKGQGGTKFIQVKLIVGSRENQSELGIITLEALEDDNYSLSIDRSSYRRAKGGRVYHELISKN
jgi:hypothetical protein